MNIKNLFSALFGAKSSNLPEDIKAEVREKSSSSLSHDPCGNIPEDIKAKVQELFPDETGQHYVLQKLGTLWQMPLNVGPAQLARGILVLAGSSRNKLDTLFDGDFMGDPRDLLTSADKKLGNPGHYCAEPFGTAYHVKR